MWVVFFCSLKKEKNVAIMVTSLWRAAFGVLRLSFDWTKRIGSSSGAARRFVINNACSYNRAWFKLFLIEHCILFLFFFIASEKAIQEHQGMWHLYQGMRHLCQGYLRVITQQYFLFLFNILSRFSSYHTDKFSWNLDM